MKKGETYTGRVQHVDFPNKAVVFTESENPEDNGQGYCKKFNSGTEGPVYGQ